jgi:hypothetical protein
VTRPVRAVFAGTPVSGRAAARQTSKEETMKARSIVMTMLCGAATLVGTQASACEVVRTPWGMRYSGCQLRELYHGRFDLLLEKQDPPYRIGLPNLRITDIDADPSGGISINMDVEFENNGNRNVARAFDLTLMVTVHDPLMKGVAVSMTPLPVVQVPGLNMGASATAYPGAIALPNRAQDWDVCSIGVIDAPPPNSPSGVVWELDENDNVKDSCTRIFAKP